MLAKKMFFIICPLIVALLVACAPKAAPPPPSSAQPAQSQPRALTPEEQAWNATVEAAKKEGKVTLYTFSFTGDIGKAIAEAFEAKYGIKLEFVTGVGATLVERVKSEQAGKVFLADTVDTSVVQVAILKREGMTQSAGPLPALKEKDAWVADPSADAEGHVVSMRSTVLTPFINTKVIEPKDAPKSLRDMLSPKWKKQIAMGNPLTVPVTVWAYLVYKKNSVLDDNYWRQLGLQEPRYGNSVRDVATFVSRAETAITFYLSDTAIAPLVKEGAPIQAIEVQEGVILVPQSSGIAMVKGAPHPNAARVFINWILAQEGQTSFANAMGGMLSLRKDVVDRRPSALKTEQKKVFIVDLAMQEETSKVQKDMTINKLLGIEK